MTRNSTSSLRHSIEISRPWLFSLNFLFNFVFGLFKILNWKNENQIFRYIWFYFRLTQRKSVLDNCQDDWFLFFTKSLNHFTNNRFDDFLSDLHRTFISGASVCVPSLRSYFSGVLNQLLLIFFILWPRLKGLCQLFIYYFVTPVRCSWLDPC